MTCAVAPPLTAEEERARAPNAIQLGKNIFKKMSYVLGDRDVYHHRSEQFIFYEKPKGLWKLGEAAVIGRPSLLTSKKTKVYSPDQAIWLDEKRGEKVSMRRLGEDEDPNAWHPGLKINHAIEDGWKDPDFAHSNDSIGSKVMNEIQECRWLRALALHPRPVLFADVEPADACQGSVGNCWLVAAMSALAEFPSYMKNNLFVTKKAQTSFALEVECYL